MSKPYGHQSVLFTSFDVLQVCGRRVLLTVGDQVSIQATENVDYSIGVGSRGPVHMRDCVAVFDRGEQMMDSCFCSFGMSRFFFFFCATWLFQRSSP